MFVDCVFCRGALSLPLGMEVFTSFCSPLVALRVSLIFFKFDRDRVFSSSLRSNADTLSSLGDWIPFPFIPFSFGFVMKSNLPGSFLPLQAPYSPMVTDTGRVIFFIVGGPVFCGAKYMDGGRGTGDEGFFNLKDSSDSISAASPFAFTTSEAAATLRKVPLKFVLA